MEPMTKRLDILLFKECNHDGCDQWVAQCLQHDIVGQGNSIDDAIFGLEACIVGHVQIDLKKNREPLAWIPAAPKKHWMRFEQAKRISDEDLPTLFDSEFKNLIPPAFMIPKAPDRQVRVY